MGMKLIAVDVDGTLLNSQKQVDKEVKKAIVKIVSQNKQIVLCTGKSCEEIKEIQEDLGLNHLDNYVIANDGVIIQNGSCSKVIKKSTIQFQDFIDLSEVLDQVGLHYHLRTNEGIVTPNKEIDKYTKFDSLLSNEPVTIIEKKEAAKKQIYKIMIAGEPEYLAEKVPEIPKSAWHQFTCNDHQFCFKELQNKEATKGAALAYLCHYLKVKQEDVMAIGDGYNDISMFQYAKISVAMGNASRRVQAQANYVTDSNDQQGVAKALYTWA